MSSHLYADLSHYYDRFCRDINYTQQCDYAQRVYQLFGQSAGNHYFDLACGTGQHLSQLAAAGFATTGLDNSQAMLDQAALRCPTAQLILADLAEFEYCNQFDLISCFLYSLHYSQPLTRLTQVLSRAYTALKPGGLLIFDMVDKNGINNQAGITTYLTETSAAQLPQHFAFSSQWQYSGTGDVMQLLLSINIQTADHTQRWRDTHTMSALSITQAKTHLARLGFEVYIMEHNYERLEEWAGETYNVIIVAVKPDRTLK